jgi:adenosine deaminase
MMKSSTAVRIGHAVHAKEEPQLMDYLAEHGVGTETNLTLNKTFFPAYRLW